LTGRQLFDTLHTIGVARPWRTRPQPGGFFCACRSQAASDAEPVFHHQDFTMAASAEEQERLAALVSAYQAAELAVLRNQSYQMPDGRRLTRANLSEIRDGRKEAESAYALAVGTPQVRGRARRFVNMSR
jgi:hypothetical protein